LHGPCCDQVITAGSRLLQAVRTIGSTPLHCHDALPLAAQQTARRNKPRNQQYPELLACMPHASKQMRETLKIFFGISAIGFIPQSKCIEMLLKNMA
jgi:hypothetical protein